MRADKDNPRQVYEGFFDWLQLHPVWLINVVFGYAYFLVSTAEV